MFSSTQLVFWEHLCTGQFQYKLRKHACYFRRHCYFVVSIVVLSKAAKKLPTDHHLQTKSFWTSSEHGQAEPFAKFCLLLNLRTPAGIFKFRNIKQMCCRSQNGSVGLVASLKGGRLSMFVRYRLGRTALLCRSTPKSRERPWSVPHFRIR